MILTSGSARHRTELRAAYDANRRRTRALFDMLASDAYYDAPIPLRHPFVFYDGHIPGFSFLTLIRGALGGAAVDEELESLFQRGIDPATAHEAVQKAPAAWPSRERVEAFARDCDARVRAALDTATLDDPGNPRLVRAQSAFNIIEHEQMHHETLMYIVHRLGAERKRPISQRHSDAPTPRYARAAVDAGIATLGAQRDAIPFGWDNEFEEQRVAVGAFEIDVYNVTNGQYMEFVRAGGAPPPFWRRNGDAWELATLFEWIPLPGSWPVYVTQAQAQEFARWKSMRLPSEAEYHRAAFGTRDGGERAHPWGDEPPRREHGNFGFARFDPEPVGAHPQGTSAWGVADLVGNGWEWTSTPFAPLAGFAPMASYPQYSVDFFDGAHFVLKGASPVTHERLIRRSFRNWFRADYPYVYATFRCVS